MIEKVIKKWQSQATVNTLDGVRLDTADWWVHLRKSNTEPIIRVIAEARSEVQATEICKQFMDELTK